eukprot:1648501-Pyramimonas_sp.AAC.1
MQVLGAVVESEFDNTRGDLRHRITMARRASSSSHKHRTFVLNMWAHGLSSTDINREFRASCPTAST